MTTTQQLSPGTEVRFTTYGKKGAGTGTLNGYSYEEGFGVMAWIRLDNGNVISRSAERVTAA